MFELLADKPIDSNDYEHVPSKFCMGADLGSLAAFSHDDFTKSQITFLEGNHVTIDSCCYQFKQHSQKHYR